MARQWTPEREMAKKIVAGYLEAGRRSIVDPILNKRTRIEADQLITELVETLIGPKEPEFSHGRD